MSRRFAVALACVALCVGLAGCGGGGGSSSYTSPSTPSTKADQPGWFFQAPIESRNPAANLPPAMDVTTA